MQKPDPTKPFYEQQNSGLPKYQTISVHRPTDILLGIPGPKPSGVRNKN